MTRCGYRMSKMSRLLRIIVASNAGKFLVGYMPVGGEKEYYLATSCPELYVPPGAYISITGLKVQGQFLGGKYDLIYILYFFLCSAYWPPFCVDIG